HRSGVFPGERRMRRATEGTPGTVSRTGDGFSQTVSRNCVGCHGADGMKGPGPRLHDPLYLAVADRESIFNAIKYGRPGTPMPPFGKDEAGPLTDQQIAAIVDGMERNWGQPEKFKGATLPTYSIEKA